MRLYHLLWLFILWVNVEKSLQQDEIKCRLDAQPLKGTSYEPAFRNEFSPGERVRVICGEKHWIIHPQSTSAVTTCGNDGQWTGRPICKEVTCSQRRDPLVNHWQVYGWQRKTLGETASYRCRSGYRSTDGTNRATCTRAGWMPNPLCKELVGCESPPPLTDGDIRYTMKSNYSHKESVEYVCQTYFTMEGGPNRTCIDGEWTGRMRCLKPCVVNEDELRPQNVTLKSTDKKYFSHDEMIEFSCVRGIPVGTVAMQQRCNSGVILLPACN